MHWIWILIKFPNNIWRLSISARERNILEALEDEKIDLIFEGNFQIFTYLVSIYGKFQFPIFHDTLPVSIPEHQPSPKLSEKNFLQFHDLIMIYENQSRKFHRHCSGSFIWEKNQFPPSLRRRGFKENEN